MTSTTWTVIAGFSDYDVSPNGHVRSRRGGKCVALKGTVTEAGYIAYILRANDTGKPCRRLVHRLVALAYLPKPDEGQTDVCHNDGNPSNNSVGNLRWDSHQGNQMDMRSHGTMQDGEKCVTAVLTAAQALDVRDTVLREGHGAGRKMCAKYGISPAQVSRIKNGKRWASLAEVAA
ncbi:HNH endonuclease [Pseudomonas capeferrum]|uniref:HNH endonuclease n=1 Tax=Pseudomonas capeferrum TaxID=1495066 RepID=UPI001C612D7B|nr:HNH endonuclease [Pseudomonas capeferrum]MBA1200440.1 HNH endonuclease [Pseudomonas capeferrum]